MLDPPNNKNQSGKKGESKRKLSILNFESDLRQTDTKSNEHATPTSNIL